MALYNYNGVIYSGIRSAKVTKEEYTTIGDGRTEYDGYLVISDVDKIDDLCIAAEKDGKLGFMVRCKETANYQTLFKCREEDFKFDTLKIFADKDGRKAYVIGSHMGTYHCFLVAEMEFFFQDSESHTEMAWDYGTHLVCSSPVYEECFKHVSSADKDLELIRSVSASKIERLAPNQVFVFGANREEEHRVGAYALPAMDGDLHMLRREIRNFMAYAEAHPEQEFVLTKIGSGNSIWSSEDILSIFTEEPYWMGSNILKPLEWSIEDTYEHFKEPEVGIKIAGRQTFDEWVGNLAIMYAVARHIDLGFSKEGISIRSANSDDLCKDLISRFNSRNAGEGQITDLSITYKELKSFPTWKYDGWYAEFLQNNLFKLCSGFEEGSTTNPPRQICDFVNGILRNHSCFSVYNPFAGLGTLSRYCTGYTHQEPSTEYTLVSRLIEDVRGGGNTFVTGDFNTDWLAEGHDAIVCIPPIGYGKEEHPYDTSDEKTAVLERHRRTLKLLMHRLTQPCKSLKLSMVFVSDDFLYSDEFENYRKIFCDLGILRNVIRFSEDTFSDMRSGGAVILLDYTQKRDSVIFTEQAWLDDLEVFNDFIDDAYEFFEEDPKSFCIPYSMIALSHYCLIDKFYGYASNISRTGAPVSIDSDQYDLIPLKELVTPVKGEYSDCVDKTLISTDVSDYSFLCQNIISGETHKKKLEGKRRRNEGNLLEEAVGRFSYISDRLFPGGTLFISHLGMIFNSSDDEVLLDTEYPGSVAILPDREKIDPLYLIGTLSSNAFSRGLGIEAMIRFLNDNYTKSFEDVLSYVINWRVPVPENGLEAQREVVSSLKRMLPSAAEKTYSILAVGDIDAAEFKGRNLNVVGEGRYPTFSKDFMAELRNALNGNNAPDAVVIAYSFGEKGIERTLRQTDAADIPLFILRSEGDDLSDDYLDDDQIAYFKDNRLHGNVSGLIDSLRKELDYKNSPEAAIRKEYEAEFNAATAVQKAFGSKIDIAREMELILVETRKQDFCLAERSFDFFRNVRDLVLEELVKSQALPNLDNGALTSLLADKVYKESHYMIRYLMSNNLAAGLQYLTFVSNEAVHNSNGEKDTAMSAVHILFQLLLWAQERIREGFFEADHAGEFFTQRDMLEKCSYSKSEAHIVKVTKKANKPYFYTGNVHINISKNSDELQEGDMVYFYGTPKPEKEPFITEELQVYLIINNWGKEKQ